MNWLLRFTVLLAVYNCGCTAKSDNTSATEGTAGTSAGGAHGAAAGASAGGQPSAFGGATPGGSPQGGSALAGSAAGGAASGGSSPAATGGSSPAAAGGSSPGGAASGGSSPGASSGSSPGGAASGGSAAGAAAQGGSAMGGLPPVEGRIVSPPASPVPVAEGSVQVCKTGDTWVTLLSKNNIGCAKACQSQGMNCRRSYHDVAGACEPQPYELGCGQLAEQGTDFCACSRETFFQGKLFTESPKTRVAPPIETCQTGQGWATLVFHDRSGCNAACARAGLKCYASYENLDLECGPQADPAFKLDCDNTLAHVGDFCVCTVDGSAAGLPPSVVTPWKPF